jgi:filamentous hemagglutinin
MYAADRTRAGNKAIFEPGTDEYMINTTRKSFDDIPTPPDKPATAKLDVNPQSGKIRDGNGNLMTTDNVNSEGLMYVIDENGTIFIGGRGGERSFPHPTLIGGTNPNVKCAGMIRFKDGRILEITNHSGHFKPSAEAFEEAKAIFRKRLSDKSFDPEYLKANP